MGIVALVLGMFSIDTQEFRETANAQMKDGYKWEYVGKTKPSGVPPTCMVSAATFKIEFDSSCFATIDSGWGSTATVADIVGDFPFTSSIFVLPSFA